MPNETVIDTSESEVQLAGALYVLRLTELVFVMALLAIPLFAVFIVPLGGLVGDDVNYYILIWMALALMVTYPLLYSLRRGAKVAFIAIAAVNAISNIAFLFLLFAEPGISALYDAVLTLVFGIPLVWFSIQAVKLPRRYIELFSLESGNPLSWTTFLQTIGAPQNVGVTSQKIVVLTLSFFSVLFLAMWFNAIQNLGVVFGEMSPSAFQTGAGTIGLFVGMGLSVIIIVCAYHLSRFFGRAALKLCRTSMKRALSKDSRPPILFLRSFRDDQVRLTPSSRGPFSDVIGAERHLDTMDGLIVDEGTRYGPVVALGKPGEAKPPFGAARDYVDEASWQKILIDLVENARAIIVCIDRTAGVLWEISLIEDRGMLRKTLFVFPRFCDPAETVRLLNAQGSATSARLISEAWAASNPSSIVAAFSDVSGIVHGLTSVHKTAVAYLLGVRMFLRSLEVPISRKRPSA